MSNWAKVILILCFEITSVFGLNQFAAAMEKERNMRAEDLPAGTGGAPLAYPHFPTRWQAVVWRNWELVSPARLAAVLGCSEAEIVQAASEMGLTVEPKVNPKWITHGYLTLIRNNWQLLPYSQMLELLGWTPGKMAFTLKEEDFFWVKVGKVRPAARTGSTSTISIRMQPAAAMCRGMPTSSIRCRKTCWLNMRRWGFGESGCTRCFIC